MERQSVHCLKTILDIYTLQGKKQVVAESLPFPPTRHSHPSSISTHIRMGQSQSSTGDKYSPKIWHIISWYTYWLINVNLPKMPIRKTPSTHINPHPKTEEKSLPGFGLQATREGVTEMIKRCAEHLDDPEVAQLMDSVNANLGCSITRKKTRASWLGFGKFWDKQHAEYTNGHLEVQQ